MLRSTTFGRLALIPVPPFALPIAAGGAIHRRGQPELSVKKLGQMALAREPGIDRDDRNRELVIFQ